MKREIIYMADEGFVVAPRDLGAVRMSISEIAAAVAFRVHSWQADAFRQWLMERVTQPTHAATPPIAVLLPVK